MLSIKMAQGLRVDLKDLQEELKQLEQQHAVLKTNKDRAGMVQLTKHINSHKERIDRINEALKDAPVEPWEPERVWEVILIQFPYRKEFEEYKVKFLEEVAENVSYCLEWQACSIVKSQKKAQLTNWVCNLEKIENLVERIEKFYEYKVEFIERLQKEILRGARKQTSKSTSQSSNLVESAQLEATAEMLDKFDRWHGFGLERAKEHFESWKELNQE